MLLVKLPVPVPSVVLLGPVATGPVEVPQHTPRAVIVAPPSEVMFPPEVAVVLVTEEASAVVSTGTTERVVNVTSAP